MRGSLILARLICGGLLFVGGGCASSSVTLNDRTSPAKEIELKQSPQEPLQIVMRKGPFGDTLGDASRDQLFINYDIIRASVLYHRDHHRWPRNKKSVLPYITQNNFVLSASAVSAEINEYRFESNSPSRLTVAPQGALLAYHISYEKGIYSVSLGNPAVAFVNDPSDVH